MSAFEPMAIIDVQVSWHAITKPLRTDSPKTYSEENLGHPNSDVAW